MEVLFRDYIREHKLFDIGEHLLVATSGGIDSMVLCTLLLNCKYNISVAHCNFQLRGEDANVDEDLVKQFCESNKVPFYSIRFNTAQYARENKSSIQMAARELRYTWFEALMNEHGFDKLLTAHHLNDNIETFFINLLRGAGLNGLKGILPIQNKIVRPLLFAKRQDVEKYAKIKTIRFREDSSNADDKYLRNKLRLNILPLLKEINPSFEGVMYEELKRLRDAHKLLTKVLEEEKRTCVLQDKYRLTIDINKLLSTKAPSLLLFEILKDYGFHAPVIKSIEKALYAESGKVFYSKEHQIVKDRNLLVVTLIEEEKRENEVYYIDEGASEINLPLHLKFTYDKYFEHFNSPSKVNIDASAIRFPLRLEKWQKGDKFKPLGMDRFKKLSDFFINEKFSLTEKQQQWLLKNSNGDIIWVIGKRIDDRFKITAQTNTCIQIILCNTVAF